VSSEPGAGQFAGQREKDPVILDLIEHLLLYFGRCFENRNVLTHSKQYFANSNDFLLALEKKPKGKEHVVVQGNDAKRVQMFGRTRAIIRQWPIIFEVKHGQSPSKS
jgi:hypothetical protein